MIRQTILLACCFAVPLPFCAFSWLPSAHADNVICVEAESADTVNAPMRIVDFKEAETNDAVAAVKGASKDKYLEIPRKRPTKPAAEPTEAKADAPTGNTPTAPPKGDCLTSPKKGSASITIHIPEDGRYYLWGRAWWMDECRNSITIVVDKKPGFTFGDDRTFKCWHWVKALNRLKLSKGKHTFQLKQREPGVKIDQLLLADDRRYIPVGIENSGKGE